MIKVIRIVDGVETEVGTAETWLSAAAMIEASAKIDRELSTAAFYTASTIEGGGEE